MVVWVSVCVRVLCVSMRMFTLLTPKVSCPSPRGDGELQKLNLIRSQPLLFSDRSNPGVSPDHPTGHRGDYSVGSDTLQDLVYWNLKTKSD